MAINNKELIKAREYYDLVESGKSRKEAALIAYGNKAPFRIEATEEYIAVINAVARVQQIELAQEIEETRRKQLKHYSKMLDRGDEIYEQAETTNEKIAAQANQRANLELTLVDKNLAWNSENRNDVDMGDILEGVLV